jgi:isopenicillin N synthase-like dioxygenase
MSAANLLKSVLPIVSCRCSAADFTVFSKQLAPVITSQSRQSKLEFRFTSDSGPPIASSDHPALGHDIVNAASKHGFFYASNSLLHRVHIHREHQPPVSLVSAALNASSWLFALPQSVKRSIVPPSRAHIEKPERGYYRYISEALDQDSIQAFQIGPCAGEDSAASPSPLQLRQAYFDSIQMPQNMRNVGHSGNVWPQLSTDEAADFQLVLSAYHIASQLTALKMLRSVESALSFPSGQLVSAHSRSDSLLELKHYPALKLGADQTRLVAHADLSSFTLLAQDSMGGLQVASEESWIDAPARDDAVLVNTGDYLQDWTCGFLPSTIHRVHAADGVYQRARHSIVHFFTPNWDATVQPRWFDAGRSRFEAGEAYSVGDRMPF